MSGICFLIIVFCFPLLMTLSEAGEAGETGEAGEEKKKKPELSDEMKEAVRDYLVEWSRYRRESHSKLTFPEYMELFYGKEKDSN